MKKYLRTFPDQCIACRACETTCSKLYFKVDDSEKSSIRITENAEGSSINVCNQCETCVKACQTLALRVNSQGVVILDKSLCIGCLMCVAACPTASMQTHPDLLNPFKCISCGICVKSCPTEAINLVTE